MSALDGKRLVAAVRLDVQLQARSQLYGIGVAVAVMMGLFGRFLVGTEHAGLALPIFYLLGVGGTTFMFGASMLLLEKSQGTLQALRVSPMSAREYLASKALTLTSFAVVESAIAFALIYGGQAIAPLKLLLGLLCLGFGYTCIGLGLACKHESVTSFLFPSAVLVSMVLQLPFLGPLGVGSPALWWPIPSAGPLELMLAAFDPEASLVYGLAMSLAFVVGSGAFASLMFNKHIGLRRS